MSGKDLERPGFDGRRKASPRKGAEQTGCEKMGRELMRIRLGMISKDELGAAVEKTWRGKASMGDVRHRLERELNRRDAKRWVQNWH